jgi:hypothetical protein
LLLEFGFHLLCDSGLFLGGIISSLLSLLECLSLLLLDDLLGEGLFNLKVHFWFRWLVCFFDGCLGFDGGLDGFGTCSFSFLLGLLGGFLSSLGSWIFLSLLSSSGLGLVSLLGWDSSWNWLFCWGGVGSWCVLCSWCSINVSLGLLFGLLLGNSFLG